MAELCAVQGGDPGLWLGGHGSRPGSARVSQPSPEGLVSDQSHAHYRECAVSARERIDQLYSFGWARWYYAFLLLLTFFLLVWTLATHDLHHLWVHICEAVLTLLFSLEVGMRVYVSWPALKRSWLLCAEVLLAVLCVVAFLLSISLSARKGEDLAETLEDALLGVRYIAQTLRLVFLWRSHRRQQEDRRIYLDYSSGSLSHTPGSGAHAQIALDDVHHMARSLSNVSTGGPHKEPSPRAEEFDTVRVAELCAGEGQLQGLDMPMDESAPGSEVGDPSTSPMPKNVTIV
eukprot:TRINITY_DN34397_c0_g1_i1.p1 TRINITY_DN34397_c0_g1~~TRINITY_DN34397_c0_g1_i1.p1  ORF type:complete len:289 (+),score=84.04 TRINITY_DN34397_c0_g1_i1:68-934(+)